MIPTIIKIAIATWLVLVGFDTFVARPFGIVNIVPHRHHVEYRDCQMRLYTTDGDVVLLDPTPYFDKDGRLPNIFQYQGRTFERGNDDRLLWFEVTEPHPESESSAPKEWE